MFHSKKSIFFMFMITTFANTSLNCFFNKAVTPVQINLKNFEKEVLESETPVILYAFQVSSWRCKAVSSIFVELCPEFADKLKFVAMDLDSNDILANYFDVRYVPAFMLFYDGKWIEMVQENVSKESLKALCKAAIETCKDIDEA